MSRLILLALLLATPAAAELPLHTRARYYILSVEPYVGPTDPNISCAEVVMERRIARRWVEKMTDEEWDRRWPNGHVDDLYDIYACTADTIRSLRVLTGK